MKNRYEVKGEFVVIFLDREDGSVLETIIDKDDLNRAQKIRGKWYANWNKSSGSFYVKANTVDADGKKGSMPLHRWLTNCPNGLVVDHIDHNTLNNTRQNIRNVTHLENMQNRKIMQTNQSGQRGISMDKRTGKWRARIKVYGKRIHIGLFSDIMQASRTVCNARLNLMPSNVVNNKGLGGESINMERRICPHCNESTYSSRFDGPWECPSCGETNEKLRPALQCQTEQQKINSRLIIPRSTDFRPVCLFGFIGSVGVFRQFIKGQRILLDAGIILP